MNALEKIKLLVIDDEEVILDGCTQIFSNEDVVVETAFDGTKGLVKVKEIKPDVVLVDLKMPGISGIEVLEKIKEIDNQIITIVLTGYATIDTAIDSMKRGAYDFITKPFTPDELRITVKKAMEKRKLSLETNKLRQEKEKLRQV